MASARFDGSLVVFLREREMMHQKRRRWLEGSAPPWKLESLAYLMLGKWSQRDFLTIHCAKPTEAAHVVSTLRLGSVLQNAINIYTWEQNAELKAVHS